MLVSDGAIKAVRVPSHPVDGAGSRTFNNYYLFGLSFIVSGLLIYYLSLPKLLFVYLGLIIVLPMFGIFVLVHSRFGGFPPSSFDLPGKPIEEYMTMNDANLLLYSGRSKIPMDTFIENYIQSKINIKGDCLDMFELRYDWATFEITWNQAVFFLTGFLPEMLFHTSKQDLDQVREHYDRGNDFYSFFLGKPMVYTSGIISDLKKEETIEELQENKLNLVAKKLHLKEGETLLDLGCGWGTFACHAAKYFGVKATGVTLAKEQHKFCLKQAEEYGVSEQTSFLCQDARDIPRKKYDKIACVEMAEHVGVIHFQKFMVQIREMLEDDGLYFMQVSGLRSAWQYEDFVWGLFMNKYIFPGADASTPLHWYISQLEKAGFEVLSVDTIGCHYSATILRWYKLWISNKAEILDKYGERWFRLWEVFLAWSVIMFRQGTAACYQITSHKNINSFSRYSLVDGKRLVA
ncbi:hypothetical protein DSO57_1009354 [Entomophthora muscae]|uniref:Uncharacterized protein n=1 Tax=Entomophthora muscae TaxID=34485 RepID=A0ACC2RY39_9FUNG|nr:hypothetical protein DSO57_1009354 [Entomophthora muscae]